MNKLLENSTNNNNNDDNNNKNEQPKQQKKMKRKKCNTNNSKREARNEEHNDFLFCITGSKRRLISALLQIILNISYLFLCYMRFTLLRGQITSKKASK